MKPTGAGQSPALLSHIVGELGRLGIGYAIVGALASSFHGVVRSSLDADAVISCREQAEVARLINLLRGSGYEVEHRLGGGDDPVESVISVSDEFRNRVDLLTGIRGMSPDYVARTVEAPLFGSKLQIIGAEDLVAMKLFAGSPRDLEDARGVLEVSAESINFELLRRLAARYGSEVLATLERLISDAG